MFYFFLSTCIMSLKLFLNLLNKHSIEHPEERIIRQQLSLHQDATTRSKSFFLRKNINLWRIDRSTAARETTVPLTCVCISQRCMSQEALDTLLDEKGKQDVYSSSDHLGYSLVLMASLSYLSQLYTCTSLLQLHLQQWR